MTLEELKGIVVHNLEDGEDLYGNMCFYCSKQNCKYLLSGKLYEGQEIGPGKYGGNRIYNCPAFIMPKTQNEKDEKLKYKPDTTAVTDMAEYLHSLNNECKYNNIYQRYCK